MSKLVDIKALDEIVEALKKGSVIAFPTDTVFGLGCSIDHIESIIRIKKIKERDPNKALPIMVSSVDMIKDVALLDAKNQALIENLGPGAITYILPKQPKLDQNINNGLATVAIRIPDNQFILQMIKQLNRPMAVTSCNISNQPSLFKVEDVFKQFDDKVDLIVNQDAQSALASTIYDCVNDQILRQGVVSLEKIRSSKNVRSKIS